VERHFEMGVLEVTTETRWLGHGGRLVLADVLGVRVSCRGKRLGGWDFIPECDKKVAWPEASRQASYDCMTAK
jgi:hypothetical protein